MLGCWTSTSEGWQQEIQGSVHFPFGCAQGSVEMTLVWVGLRSARAKAKEEADSKGNDRKNSNSNGEEPNSGLSTALRFGQDDGCRLERVGFAEEG